MYSLVRSGKVVLTHWGRVTLICVGNLTIIGSDKGLSLGRRQTIIWTNAGIVNWTLRNNLQWNLNRNSSIFIQENLFENIVWKKAAILSRPQCFKNLAVNIQLSITDPDDMCETRIKMCLSQIGCWIKTGAQKPFGLDCASNIRVVRCYNVISVMRGVSPWDRHDPQAIWV